MRYPGTMAATIQNLGVAGVHADDTDSQITFRKGFAVQNTEASKKLQYQIGRSIDNNILSDANYWT
jgi:hypothetical protein